MTVKNTTTTYGSVAKFLHWLIFLLVLLMLIAGFFMGDIPDKSLKGQIINLHKLTGLFILILMIVRVGWVSINLKPALPLGTLAWQKNAERIVHFLIYATLIVAPVSGWVMSCAAGHIPRLFGWSLALPVAQNKLLSDQAFDWHSYVAYAIMALVSIHVLAALYHYFIKKDKVLQRML